MNISSTISRIREQANISQEKLAQSLGVSRQAVQKWEKGDSVPDREHLIAIARLFQISLDALVLNNGKRMTDELLFDRKMQPDYSSINKWEAYSAGLLTEYRQAQEEGKDLAQYEDLFKAVAKIPNGAPKEQIADILFQIVLNAPQKTDYAYVEPSDLEGIRQLRLPFELKPVNMPGEGKFKNKLTGAWMGRICGCLLGKPIEGIKTPELYRLLKQSGNYPLHRYILSTDITDEMGSSFSFGLKGRCYADTISCAPTDDDTNYTVMAGMLIEKYGRNFTPYDVSRIWLDLQSKNAYFTAERVAFRNFVNGYQPPASAFYKNPYREWIGAQIRGDYFGYINPGNPELAAEMAWRDASLSHVKNGIYGEMFAAAMLACAAVCSDVQAVIRGGLAQIPHTSRLYEIIYRLLLDYREGMGEKECFDDIHRQYDENNEHDWCHTLSNALIVAAALLYGGGDYGKTICLAVQAGFDTDCNGATAGSITGMMKGIDAISKDWLLPVRDQLDTSIFGAGRVNISDMVEMTMRHIAL